MRVLLVYAHPCTNSFNAALKESAIHTLNKYKHEIKISDLYANKFKAVGDWHDFKSNEMPLQYGVAQQYAYTNHLLTEDIQQEQEKISWSEAIILQFPLWWFGMPAILKGWLDRIFTPGFAYTKDKLLADGLLKPRNAMLVSTTQSPASAYAHDGIHGDITQYLLPINHTLRFAGLTVVAPFVAYGVMSEDNAARTQYLKNYEQALLNNLLVTRR